MIDNSFNGTLKAFQTSTATSGTSEETLASFAMPANCLMRDGQAILVRAWGVTAANGNNKTQRLMLGSTALVTTGALAANNKNWYLEALVARTGSATQTIVGNGQANGAIVATNVAAGTENLASALTVALKATDATAAGDTTLKGFRVDFLSDA